MAYIVTSPLKAIKYKCLECSNGSLHEVKLCPVTDCALYDFRTGHNPYRTKREYTDEQKAEMAERLKKARDAKSSNK